ncbi:MAG: NERD domain-containing protein [Lachnospiraceae bacterium]|nr:NERD domain-containing protein [Lachnospiraceae bacterium]
MEKRIEEILNQMNSFSKTGYPKKELLPEMFALQQEIVELTFNGEHANIAELKIWDVVKHLEQINEECGNVADEKLRKFRDDSRTLSNHIKAEISGIKGEYRAFKALENIQSPNRVIKNVELSNEKFRTEIDAVVITPKCLTIIEVKNTAKDIFIDAEGNYYRTGEYLRKDCNIADKMAIKEEMLRAILKEAGYGHICIKSVLVFTNNGIEVRNKFPLIRTCFVSHLAYIIDEKGVNGDISVNEMDSIQRVIENTKNQEAYSFDFDVRRYQEDFAELLAMLEFAKANKQKAVSDDCQNNRDNTPVYINALEDTSSIKRVGRAVMAVTFAIASGFLFVKYARKQKNI